MKAAEQMPSRFIFIRFFKRNCRYGLLHRLPHLQEKSLLDANCTGRCHAPALPFGRRDNTSTRFPLFRISISVWHHRIIYTQTASSRDIGTPHDTQLLELVRARAAQDAPVAVAG